MVLQLRRHLNGTGFGLAVQLVQLEFGLDQRVGSLDQRVLDALLILVRRIVHRLLQLLDVLRLALHQLFDFLVRLVDFLFQ